MPRAAQAIGAMPLFMRLRACRDYVRRALYQALPRPPHASDNLLPMIDIAEQARALGSAIRLRPL